MSCHVLSFSFVLFICSNYQLPSGLSQFEINFEKKKKKLFCKKFLRKGVPDEAVCSIFYKSVLAYAAFYRSIWKDVPDVTIRCVFYTSLWEDVPDVTICGVFYKLL